MARWWERLMLGVAEANRSGESVEPVMEKRPRSGRGRRAAAGGVPGGGGPTAAAPVMDRTRFPDAAPRVEPPVLGLDAGALMAEGDLLSVGLRDVRQPEAGRHAWVVALWYQVDPLQLRDGGKLQLLPDQLKATLPPACYFCEEQWSFDAMRRRCPGQVTRR
jgi:hypothetical protein